MRKDRSEDAAAAGAADELKGGRRRRSKHGKDKEASATEPDSELAVQWSLVDMEINSLRTQLADVQSRLHAELSNRNAEMLLAREEVQALRARVAELTTQNQQLASDLHAEMWVPKRVKDSGPFELV